MVTKNDSDASGADKLERFEQLCRKAGLKITPQRVVIYKALVSSEGHPSADSVYRQARKEIPNISFDTVNRTLSMLSEIGAAFVVEGSGDVKRFDGNLTDHQHFKCIKCKSIVDFHHEPFDDIDLPAEIEGRFRVLRKSVLLEGLCDSCCRLQGLNSD